MVHSATESHVEIVSKLLKAKIPVFVDKPLSYSLHDSEKLLELAAKNNLPLYVGFNRRFAPLIRSLQEVQDPLQISWQKNRVDLPGDPRVFIFDDFIHVIDSLLFLGKGKVKDLNVVSQKQNGSLINIQVQWQQKGTLLLGGMNRMSGITEETVEYYSKGNKWVIDNLHDGFHFTNEKKHILSYENSNSTLYKRGFVDMIEDWIHVLNKNTARGQCLDEAWETHQMCEKVLNQVLSD
jgi:virulence factor